ncbi:hypothetical protein DIPPA_20233 [Diplonema papillatum]|nr:hypothetical protein DIPPA_20233 [Diplonema papillatum]
MSALPPEENGNGGSVENGAQNASNAMIRMLSCADDEADDDDGDDDDEEFEEEEDEELDDDDDSSEMLDRTHRQKQVLDACDEDVDSDDIEYFSSARRFELSSQNADDQTFDPDDVSFMPGTHVRLAPADAVQECLGDHWSENIRPCCGRVGVIQRHQSATLIFVKFAMQNKKNQGHLALWSLYSASFSLPKSQLAHVFPRRQSAGGGKEQAKSTSFATRKKRRASTPTPPAHSVAKKEKEHPPVLSSTLSPTSPTLDSTVPGDGARVSSFPSALPAAVEGKKKS